MNGVRLLQVVSSEFEWCKVGRNGVRGVVVVSDE